MRLDSVRSARDPGHGAVRVAAIDTERAPGGTFGIEGEGTNVPRSNAHPRGTAPDFLKRSGHGCPMSRRMF